MKKETENIAQCASHLRWDSITQLKRGMISMLRYAQIKSINYSDCKNTLVRYELINLLWCSRALFRIFMYITWLRSNRDVPEYGSLTFSGNFHVYNRSNGSHVIVWLWSETLSYDRSRSPLRLKCTNLIIVMAYISFEKVSHPREPLLQSSRP